MADPRAIERVLKRLQLAASSSAGEAQSAVNATVSFMRRENVTVDDLLNLPTKDLYRKSVLIDVARAWVWALDGVTDYDKRQREDQLIDRIAAKWAKESGASNDSAHRQKEEELRRREEELRRQAEELLRRQQQEKSGSQRAQEEAERERRRQAYNQGSGGGFTSGASAAQSKKTPPPRAASAPGRSFLRKSWNDPKAAFDLLVVCFLFGAACGYVALFIVAICARAMNYSLPGDPDVTTVWVILTFPFMVWRGLVLFDRGWFR